MTISTQDTTLRVGSTVLECTSLTIDLDEGRAPFCTATLVVPYSSAAAALLDPQADARVTLDLSHRFGSSVTLDDLSTAWAGLDLDDLSTAWAGLDLDDLSAQWGQSWNADLIGSQTRHLDLGVRSRVINHAESTITVRAASDELLLQDYRLLDAVPLQPANPNLGALIQYVLDVAVPGARLVWSAWSLSDVPRDAAAWQPGVSAWDYLLPLTASAGQRLWCDERRVWHLAQPDDIDDGGAEPLTLDVVALTEASDETDRDNPSWFDAVVVRYAWTDEEGTAQVEYDIAAEPGATKASLVEYDRPFPGAGEAAWRLAKSAAQGHVVDTSAVSDFTAYPSRPVVLVLPDVSYTGWISAVQWTMPADEMTVRARGLTEE
jgi:hypothetical protein